MSGSHDHEDITAALAALELRVRALEATPEPEPPDPPTPLYAPLWPVTEVPHPTEQWLYDGNPAHLRARAKAGGVHILVPAQLIQSDRLPLEVGPHTILQGLDGGFIYEGAGVYVLGDHVIVDNYETRNALDGTRVFGPASDQVMIMRYSCADAEDECFDAWDAGAVKRVVLERAHLGFGARHGSSQPWSLIVGGAGAPKVGIYASVLEGGFRNPFINGNAYVYAALNVLPTWGIQGMGAINSARLAVDRNWYGYSGFHAARAHEPNATGADDRTVGIRNLGGNHYEVPPRTYEYQPELVSLPVARYRPGIEMTATRRDAVIAASGRGA